MCNTEFSLTQRTSNQREGGKKNEKEHIIQKLTWMVKPKSDTETERKQWLGIKGKHLC